MECNYHNGDCPWICWTKKVVKSWFPTGRGPQIGIDATNAEKAAKKWHKGDIRVLHDVEAKLFCGGDEGVMTWRITERGDRDEPVCQVHMTRSEGLRVLGREKQELLQYNELAVLSLHHDEKTGLTNLYISVKEPELPELFENV